MVTAFTCFKLNWPGCGFVNVSPAMDRAWLWIHGFVHSNGQSLVVDSWMCLQQRTEPGCGFMDVSTAMDRAWLWIRGCVHSNGQSLVVDSWMCPQQWTEPGCGFMDVSPAMDRAWLWIHGCVRSTSRLSVCVCRWMCSAFWCRASCLLRSLFYHAAVSASWTHSGARFTILILLLYRQGSDTRVDTRKHTHTHTRLTALFPGLPGCAGTRKVKPIGILLKQETVSGSGISWAISSLHLAPDR